jgi:hypothetical protein
MAETSTAHELELLHRLRVAGVRSPLPRDAGDLVRRGLLEVGPSGCLLSDAGCALHEELLAEERRHLDLPALAADLAAFEATRRRMLRDGLRPVVAAVRRSAIQLSRFGAHADRLDAVHPDDVAGLKAALVQCHDDYLLTLGEQR